jgi:hypothetical protein
VSDQNDLQLIENIVTRLNENPIARFSYTQAAFDNDDIEGVEVFDITADQNVPSADKTDYNEMLLNKGARAQGASIPRMGFNHFTGRPSYNVNKLVQKFLSFIGIYRSSLAHNAAEYDTAAKYKHGDICYTVDTIDTVKVFTWYRRKSASPLTISNISPASTIHWEVMQNKTSSSALLPFSAPGYRHKYSIVDLTNIAFSRNTWYPVTTELQDFEAKIGDAKEGVPQVLIEVYCNGQVAEQTSPHRAEFTVLSKFTGFAGSSADIVFNNSFVDQNDGTLRDVSTGPIGYSKLPKGRQAVIWLRGGAKYALWNSFGSDFALHNTQYANGLDSPINISPTRVYTVNPGVLRARLKSVEASEPDDAVIKSQADGALPMPRTLTIGTQLNAIRSPGSYIAPSVEIANSIQQAPVENPGPFELVVRGDKAGLQVTTQQFTVRATGDEYTRILSGNTVIQDWYLTGSPQGVNVGVSGLYIFKIIDGNLFLFFREGSDIVPEFEINNDGELIATFDLEG